MAAITADLDPVLIIRLHKGDTPDPRCAELADFLYGYFMTPAAPGIRYGRYQNSCSIIVLSETFDDYYSGAAGYATRRKVRKAEKLGYTFAPIEHDDFIDDIYKINTSLDERQGRPMDEGYRVRPKPIRAGAASTCPRHREVWYGVVHDGHLVAYTWVYMVGEMCLFNRILGHGEHMANGVMYQLVVGAIADLTATAGLRYAMYERHTSGTEGLRFFKERMGFRPYWVDWQLGDEAVISTRPFFQQGASRPGARPSLMRRVARRVRREVRRLANRSA
jgi:hypothetical protein